MRPETTPSEEPPRLRPWRQKLYSVVFLSDTPAGRTFDFILMLAIIVSVGAVMAESVEPIKQRHGDALFVIEWSLTLLFTIEYAMRLLCVRRPMAYATSFYGIVDLLTVLPTYLSLLFPGSQALIVIRALRLLRVFRIFKLPRYLNEANHLREALKSSRRKITVFVSTVLTIVLIVGSLMYVIEGPANGFTSIPTSIYWAIVTLTTVGYGDVSPKTGLGRLIASALMIVGYGIIAVPTGIVTAELVSAGGRPRAATMRSCPRCGSARNDADANYCKTCGERLIPLTRSSDAQTTDAPTTEAETGNVQRPV